MKEASGEANLTVITIILIGVVVAVAIPLVNGLMSTSEGRACCTDGGGYVDGTTCKGGTHNNEDISTIKCGNKSTSASTTP